MIGIEFGKAGATVPSMKSVVLKNGRAVGVRAFEPQDREELVSMYASLSPETLRWSMPPYNRQRVERMTSYLESSINLIAIDDKKIVGHLQISIGTSPRFSKLGDLFIYLNQNYQNLGLGAALMTEALRSARERRLHRVELTVVADNHRALHLYEKLGFRREGVKRENYLGEDGKYHDEIVMGFLL